jgi:hypothetical protein
MNKMLKEARARGIVHRLDQTLADMKKATKRLSVALHKAAAMFDDYIKASDESEKVVLEAGRILRGIDRKKERKSNGYVQ